MGSSSQGIPIVWEMKNEHAYIFPKTCEMLYSYIGKKFLYFLHGIEPIFSLNFHSIRVDNLKSHTFTMVMEIFFQRIPIVWKSK